MSSSRTVFVVDDDAAVRDALEELIDSVGLGVASFASAEDFLRQFAPDRAGCIVLDVRMPRMDGLKLQERLNELGTQIPIIFLTSHGDVQMAVQAMQRGAMDFVEKPFREQALLDSVNRALARDAEARRVQARKLQVRERLAQLTNREREVLEHVMVGKTSKTIAAELGLSPKTIDQHRAKIMEKMEADNIVALVQSVVEVGVNPGA